LDGPSEKIVFLGVLLDSVRMVQELPAGKLAELQGLVEGALLKRRLTLKYLQILAGKLSWAGQVVRGGRSFLRRILDAMKLLKLPYHKMLITQDIKEDLLWWQQYLRIFNGKAVILHAAVPKHIAYTDA
jgi:hypothetical protein